MRLTLCSAPVSAEDQYGKFAQARSSDASFGLLSLAAVAERDGHAVRLIDASANVLTVEEAFSLIIASQPDVIGLSSTSLGIMASSRLASRLKQAMPNIPIILGGAHASNLPRETLETFPQFDIGVIGEGEITLCELLTELAKGQGLPTEIRGTIVRNSDGKPRMNAPRPYITDLDQLPFPAWHLLDGFPHAFRPTPDRYRRWPTASLILSRGCPYTCRFCDQTVFQHKRRAYSPSYLIRMLTELKVKYGVREISILDSIFAVNKKQTMEFCDQLIKSGLDLSWMCHTVTNAADLELFKAMRRAGCWQIAFGIESGDQTILDAMDKRQTPDQIARAVRLAKEAGMVVKGFFIFGFPGETEQTMENTIRFATGLPIDIMHAFLFTPYPGSAVHDDAKEIGDWQYNWEAMNTQNSIFIPKGLTEKKLNTAMNRLYRSFYFRPRIILAHLGRGIVSPRLMLHMFQGLLALIRMQVTWRVSRLWAQDFPQ